jgi:hypothetical protein
MMRILSNLDSQDIQPQISNLRVGSKEEIIAQLQVSLEMFCQMKEKLSASHEELLDTKIELENYKRENVDLRRTLKQVSTQKQAAPKSKNDIELVDRNLFAELENHDLNITVESQEKNNRIETVMNVPAKFAAQKSKLRPVVPDGAGGSKGVISTSSGKHFII